MTRERPPGVRGACSTAIWFAFISGLSMHCLAAAEEGLVAHYTFDEGQSNLINDSSGRANHGTNQGATYVQNPDGNTYVLAFGTPTAYVDCGADASLDLTEAMTIQLWYNPLTTNRKGEPGIVGKGMHCFAVTQGPAGSVWCYVRGASGVDRAASPLPVPVGVWRHIAMTFDGKDMKVYQDGALKASLTTKFSKLNSAPQSPLYLRFPNWWGDVVEPPSRCMIDDVRIYNRALSPEDIRARYDVGSGLKRKTGSEPAPTLNLRVYANSGRLGVRIEFMAMDVVPKPGDLFLVNVTRGATGRSIAKARVTVPASLKFVEQMIDLQDQGPGPVSVHVQGRTASETPLGKPVTKSVTWPERAPRFSAKRGVKVLNNFVFELLNVTSPDAKEFFVNNPRDGWILATVPVAGSEGAAPTVLIDSKAFSLRRVGKGYETMQYVSEGPHRIKMADGVKANHLVVRAIPELFYATYGANPLVSETGNYTWEWLLRHVLDNYNGVVGFPKNQIEEIEEWTSRGRRWYTHHGVPRSAKTADEAFDYWATKPGMTHPLMSGIWADEFSPTESQIKIFPLLGEALRRIAGDPRFKDRQFYAYMSWTHKPGYDALIQALMDSDFRLAPEWYVGEVPSLERVRGHFGPEWERGNRANYESSAVGAGMNRVIAMGLLSQPEESCDIYPHVNFNVYLDLEFTFLANDPAFFGTRGLLGYYSPYAGEEQTRLYAKFIRHYAIEGNSERMLKDPYELTHLDNPDFSDGTKGWTLRPAAKDTIAAKTVEKLGWLEGRFVRTGAGDTAVWTKRSPEKANIIAQEIKHLEPGRLYSLRFFTGNYQDYLAFRSRPYKHDVSVELVNVDVVEEKCFQAIIKSCYAHTFEKFNRSNPYRMNYHQRIFRAKDTTAGLAFSDWASATDPGGEAREELVWNFIQVQPYFANQAEAARKPTGR